MDLTRPSYFSFGYGVKGEKGDYVPHGFRSSFRD
jgi:hypothetical protein